MLRPERKADLVDYLWGMEVIDFLLEQPLISFDAEELVGLLTKLQPRLYSIASSLTAFPDQAHFIVDTVRYESYGRQRKGVCSALMAESTDDDTLLAFPAKSKFRVPDDPDTPMIMIGPGTGIAPFRVFLQERRRSVRAGNRGSSSDRNARSAITSIGTNLSS